MSGTQLSYHIPLGDYVAHVKLPKKHLLHWVEVKFPSFKKWEWLLKEAAPETLGDDPVWEFVKLEDKKKVVRLSRKNFFLFLLNGGRFRTSEAVLRLAELNGWRPMTALECLATADDLFDLNTRLGFSSLRLVSLQVCGVKHGEHAVCTVKWDGPSRLAELTFFDYGWAANSWFGFVPQKIPPQPS